MRVLTLISDPGESTIGVHNLAIILRIIINYKVTV